MAEINIMNVAGDFSISKSTPAPWICRDDNDDYWTVIRDTSGDLRVYKSINDGTTWVLKKTLQNSDWTGNPLPTDAFQIINLVGQDKIYLFICDGVNKNKLYGWIFNVTADTNVVDVDGVDLKIGTTSNYDCHASWDDFNDRLLVVACDGGGIIDYGELTLVPGLIYKGQSIDYSPTILSYYIDPGTGYGYLLSEKRDFEYISITKKQNDVNYHTTISKSSNIILVKADIKFANIVTDSDGHPVFGYIYNDGGTTPKFKFEKRDKDNLSTILVSGSQNISSATLPSSGYMTIDGNNNLYFVFTDGSDGECYYIKYDGSWGSEVKVSSDNDGQLVTAEVRVPIADTKILVAYQATS